jgi:hypothetical protein
MCANDMPASDRSSSIEARRSQQIRASSVTRAYRVLDLEATDLCNVRQDVCGTDRHDCDSWLNQTALSLLRRGREKCSVPTMTALDYPTPLSNIRRHQVPARNPPYHLTR